ncbi:hypothetical protein [Rhodopirellula sallentina]|uniref:Membrane protein n=1 Tax=Rhodopirellula sallentina SM41 TaxID=1263870 RepID=M5TXD8_9BACT|nr:hypothetical protein [Rhodopirellula sallentina]EMI53892.1 membrane protein [Rhodopirellula sallentina SM41]
MDVPLIQPYRKVLLVVAGVWLIVAVVSVGIEGVIGAVGPESGSGTLSIVDMLIIAIVSGMVALSAILPGLPITIPAGDAENGSEGPTGAAVGLESPLKAPEASLEASQAESEFPASGPPRDVGDSAGGEHSDGETPQDGENGAITARSLPPRAAALERLGQAFLIGMLFRIGGTVALFLFSSYYMDASSTRIGIWVLAWHLVLLSAEVITLSRELPLTKSG